MGILRDITLRFIRQCFPSLFNRLRVSLSRGHVDSTDVVLSKSDPISVCGIPWQILDGKVSGLSLQLPWMNRLSPKFSVTVKSVRIHLTEVPFPTLQQLVFTALSDEVRRKKFRFVTEVERDQAPFGSSVHHIVSQILERIDIQVEDFTAVVELADGFTATFRIAKLLARRPELVSTNHSRVLIVSIQNISATINSSSSDVTVPLKIPDFSVTLGIELEGDTLKVHLDVSRIVELSIDSSLRECVHALKLRGMQWWLAYKRGRPSSCVRMDATSWMRYAYRRVSASRGLSHFRFDCESVRDSLRSFVEYKNLHVKRLNKARLKTEEISRIAELEDLFDADLIILLRHAAKRDVAADEISQFGRSEWLAWILFGHKMSSERERLTEDVRRSLELSSGEGAAGDAAQTDSGQDQDRCDRYAFQCHLNGLSGCLSGGKHEVQVSLTELGFRAGLDSETGHCKVELSLEDLLFSVDGNAVVQRRRLPKDEAEEDRDTLLMDACFSHPSDGTSSHVNLHSLSVVLHPRIIHSCSSILQQWMSPLPPMIFDRLDFQEQLCTRDGQSRNHSILCADALFTIRNTHVLLFDDRIINKGKSPALTMILKQVSIRPPPSITPFTPELDASLSLQGSEFDIHSRPTDCSVPEARDPFLPSDRQEFVSFSTHLRLTWTPTVTVNLSDAVGFICVPAGVRIISQLWTTLSSHIVRTVSSEGDDINVRTAQKAVFDASDLQERFVESDLQLNVSFLRINVIRDSQPLDQVFTLDLKEWETKLSSPSFFLVSLRVGNLCLSSSGTIPFLLLIEPTSHSQQALRLKHGSHPQSGGQIFELLFGNVSSKLSADILLAVTALISETVAATRSLAGTVHRLPSPATDEHHSTALISLLAASVDVRWSDGYFQAEINCSDFQVAAEGDRVSGSAEAVTLSKVDEGHDTSLCRKEVILHVTDPARVVNSAVRFLWEPDDIHIDVNNLTASVKRSFWDPLVSSIADFLEKLGERYASDKVSGLEDLQDSEKGPPMEIDGSAIVLILPTPKQEKVEVCVDISRVFVRLQQGLQSLSFRRTAVRIKGFSGSRGAWKTPRVESTRILQNADFDILHRNKVAFRDEGTSIHYSDTWDLKVPNVFAMALSPKSILALRNSISHLLSPFIDTEPTNAAQSRTSTCADTRSSTAEQARVLFHGSIKSLRLSLGSDGGDVTSEPFAVIDVKSICLSTAQVRDRVSTESCDVTVFTWLASCSALHLLKHQPSSEPWRIIIGDNVRRFPQYFSSHGPHGVSIRLLSRQDHGQDASTYDARINNVSVMYDPELYTQLSQFATDCFCNLNAVDQEILRETREIHNRESDDRDREVAATSDLSQAEISLSSPTSEERRVSSRCAPSAKVAVAVANATLLCSLDELCDSLHYSSLHIRKAGIVLIMSHLEKLMNGSAIRLEGISFCVNANGRGTKRFLASTDERNSLGIYPSQERSNNAHDYVHIPSSMFSSASLSQPGYGRDKLVTAVGGISAALKRSQDEEDELVLSIGKTTIDASLETLLSLAEMVSRCGLNSSTSTQTFPYNSLVAPSKLRLHVLSVCFRLSMDLSSNVGREETVSSRGSMRVDIAVSFDSVTDSCFQTSKGAVKLSVDISGDTTGHLDQLISPCLVRYQLRRERELTFEAEIRQLLRISFSPVTLRMISALNAALQSLRRDASTSSNPSALLGTDSRLVVQVYGIAVRCLSDVPRIQVLRLLLGDIRIDATLSGASASRLFDFSIRELLLEDTISWRLFRSDPTNSSSRRWERIVASIPQPVDGSAPRSSESSQDLPTRDMRLYTTRLPSENTGLSIRPALRFHVTWSHHFEDLKARIDSSGLDVNLDLVALPVILEWCRSLVREFPAGNGSTLNDDVGLFTREVSQRIIQRGPWFSEVHLEPLTITGGIRAAPRRLEESIYERVLTFVLNVDSVTGLALQLPAVHIRGEQESLTSLLHQIISAYSRSTVSHQFLWQILAQSRKLSRLVRLFAVSMFRRRSYNPLRLSTQKTKAVAGNRRSVGLLAALDSAVSTHQLADTAARSTMPLVVHRIGWTRGMGPQEANVQPSSIHVIDLT